MAVSVLCELSGLYQVLNYFSDVVGALVMVQNLIF